MESTDVIVITNQCFMCHEHGEVTLTFDQFERYNSGAYIQVALPELEAGLREQLISGTHPACWERMFDESMGLDEDDYDPELECEGHPSTDGPIGNVTYCDGSCKS